MQGIVINAVPILVEKKKMKKYLLMIMLILTIPGLKAQDITTGTLVWMVDGSIDVNSGTTNVVYDRLVSYGRERVEWLTLQGELIHAFTIIEINGQWINVENGGTILYEVKSLDRQGTVQFSRLDGVLSIQIVLLKPSENPDIYRLSVSSVAAP